MAAFEVLAIAVGTSGVSGRGIVLWIVMGQGKFAEPLGAFPNLISLPHFVLAPINSLLLSTGTVIQVPSESAGKQLVYSMVEPGRGIYNLLQSFHLSLGRI